MRWCLWTQVHVSAVTLALWTQVHVSALWTDIVNCHPCAFITSFCKPVHFALKYAASSVNIYMKRSCTNKACHKSSGSNRASHNDEYFSTNNSPNKEKITMHLLKQLKLVFSVKSICSFSSIFLLNSTFSFSSCTIIYLSSLFSSWTLWTCSSSSSAFSFLNRQTASRRSHNKIRSYWVAWRSIHT